MWMAHQVGYKYDDLAWLTVGDILMAAVDPNGSEWQGIEDHGSDSAFTF